MATMAQAKRDFDNGMLRGFRIEKQMDRKVVQLMYVVNGGFSISHDSLDDARTKKPRLFKTYDAAVSALEMIGFRVDVLGS